MGKRLCPICGSGKYESIHKIKLLLPKEYQLPEEYNIVSCNECGFCFSDTKATLENYNNYYTKCNTYSGTPVSSEEWDRIYCPALKLIEPYINMDSYLIDMGFGKGNFLKLLNEYGYSNVLGIDPSEDSVNHIKEQKINAILGSVFNEADKEYKNISDCIFLFDVLEHLLYPFEAINTLKSYMKKGSYFLISVPNYAFLKENQYPIVNMFNQEHINYFSIISLNNLLNKCGFQIISTNQTDSNEEIIALYQLRNGSDNYRIEKDDICKNEIINYIGRFEYRLNKIIDSLEFLKNKNITEVYVWGTGAYTMWLLANTILNHFDIKFIDNNKTKIGKKIGSGIVISPNDINQSDLPILICSMLYGDKIYSQIKDMKLCNDIYIL